MNPCVIPAPQPPVIPALLIPAKSGNTPDGGKSPTVSRSATPVIPALLLRHSREEPAHGPRSGAGTHVPDQGASHPQSAGAPPPSFPHSFFVIPAKSLPRTTIRGGNPRDQGASHPQSAGAPPPSFPHSFFVIPAKAGTHGPDYPNNSPTLSRPTHVSDHANNSPTLSRSTTPVIPALLLRHSREGGNPRPRPGGKSLPRNHNQLRR